MAFPPPNRRLGTLVVQPMAPDVDSSRASSNKKRLYCGGRVLDVTKCSACSTSLQIPFDTIALHPSLRVMLCKVSSYLYVRNDNNNPDNHHHQQPLQQHRHLNIHRRATSLCSQRCYRAHTHHDFTRGEDGKDEYCQWCADGGELICCDVCTRAFCRSCIKRNVGRSALSAIDALDDSVVWKCFVCDPTPIEVLQKRSIEVWL